MDFMGLAEVAAISVIAYLIGEAVKLTKLDKRWIPVICGGSGAALGALALYIMPDFPANDILTAIAVGIASGLAATGVNQISKQMNKEE